MQNFWFGLLLAAAVAAFVWWAVRPKFDFTIQLGAGDVKTMSNTDDTAGERGKPDPQASDSERRQLALPPQRFGIAELMLLVAGIALGLWMVLNDLRATGEHMWEPAGRVVLIIVFILGGISAMGPPLLLWERRIGRGLWGPGKIIWFSQGMASWLLWPPVVYARIQGKNVSDTTSGMCYFYGTPVMAVYVAIALLAGGWIGLKRRQTRLSWRERFGLLLGMAWACTGLYILYVFYREDFSR